jgi:hypothetical protein
MALRDESPATEESAETFRKVIHNTSTRQRTKTIRSIVPQGKSTFIAGKERKLWGVPCKRERCPSAEEPVLRSFRKCVISVLAIKQLNSE